MALHLSWFAVSAIALVGCAKAPPAAPVLASASAPGPKASGVLLAVPAVSTDNKSSLIVGREPATIAVSASSSYSGWPARNAVDGDTTTSWYSARDDSAAHGKVPFIQVAFTTPATVRRVTLLGNRDPSYLEGYTILSGKLELFDESGRVLASSSSTGTGNQRDFDFRLPTPVAGVKVVRFSSLDDQGQSNAYGDVAIAELQVE